MAVAIFDVEIPAFKKQALQWAAQFSEVCFFESNGYNDEYNKIEAFLAVESVATFASSTNSDTFKALEEFKAKHPGSWMLGFFSYDLKDEIEDLTTPFPNRVGFPMSSFFVPATVLRFANGQVEIQGESPELVYEKILSTLLPSSSPLGPLSLQKRMSKADYMESFALMQQHIQQGDIYEVNLCQEFYAEEVDLDPLSVYEKLSETSPTPFSVFFKLDDRYILSASPERFLAKRGSTLISQPIKGTAPRGRDSAEDARLIAELSSNPKEIAENVMIVDLVRNDLTRSAIPGTVDAQRKLEVHSFKQVHQLISTVVCEQNPALSDAETIKNTFPPGSMTGAPKISAMQLCDRYENSMRGVYSGAVGYFAPDGDFDFNVVIRSILYNKTTKYLSFHTGGAITIDAVAEKEYDECLLKASAIVQVLGGSLS